MDSATATPEDFVLFHRGPSTVTSSSLSTASTSSPEFTVDSHDSAVTPDSDDDDNDSGTPSVKPKIEELEDEGISGIDHMLGVEHAKPVIGPLPQAPRKRGRPRKHPIVDQKKTSHARSKTGCGTCRRRKKKCDEAKPVCQNCEKNNVVCDGYEAKQPWRSGKQKALTVRQSSVVPAPLPELIPGVEGPVDQYFFQHFTCQLGKVLSLTDHHNPFLQIIVPMAVQHLGLMHSLLYLSGSCLTANEPVIRLDWEQRHEHHSSNAMVLLQRDIGNMAIAGDSNAVDTVVAIGDPSIAQTLILCLQTVCAGDLSGSYRHHLKAMKAMLSSDTVHFPNDELRKFILEFLLYHEYSASITSLVNTVDHTSIALMEDFKLPEYMIQPSAGTLLGVLDGLFGYISRIRHLRDRIREKRTNGGGHWWSDEELNSEAWAIANALGAWQCAYPESSPRYTASLLYRLSTYIYLQRTIQFSRASDAFRTAVNEGLNYLRMLPPSDSTQSILLMPLFLLGCAAFDPDQRPEIAQAFERLQKWSTLGNIKYARAVVEQMWQMMDEGREDETWDWETIIAGRGWDFLIT